MKLMWILERIKKNLDKESESSQSGSHRFPDEEIRSKIDNRHHQHSQKNSHTREHTKSSPSPVNKHTSSGVDELKGEMNMIKFPTFFAKNQKDEEVETWLIGMRRYFQLHNYSSHVEGRITVYQMKGNASL
jgi:ribosome-binding ATPase YchF (GTP1/OBG family)